MYVYIKTVARSRNHCCSRNATVYSVCVCVCVCVCCVCVTELHATVSYKKILGVA